MDELGLFIVNRPENEVVVPDPVTEPNPENPSGEAAGGVSPKVSPPEATEGPAARSSVTGEAGETGTTGGADSAGAVGADAETRSGSATLSAKEAAASSVAAASAGLTGGQKVLEWFWLGRAIKAVHARGLTLTSRGQELLRRGRLASELAGRALEPPEPLPSGSGDALACELYRESIEWCLAAHREQSYRGAPPAAGVVEDLPALWDSADPELLAKAAGGTAGADKLRREIVARSYRDFAELDATEQVRLARSLRLFADALIGQLDTAQGALDRLWLKRIVRLGLAAAAVAGLVLLVTRAATMSEGGKDLAVGAMWTASSTYGAEPGCPPPQQECAASPNFFIHTNEEAQPWLMFDLKSPKKVSAVRVDNRLDFGYDRAIPLVIEVSDDEKKWKEVARRTTDFSSWKAAFDPVEARFVRLRILKDKTNLHFSRVRILP